MRYAVFLLLGLSIWACTSGNRAPAGPPPPSNLSGKELAEIHCANCHMFPAPDLLDKSGWQNGVLPEMAYRMGVKPLIDKIGSYDPSELAAVLQSGNYPDQPLVAEEDWQKIIRYYVDNAPEKPLPQAPKTPVKTGLPFFEVKTVTESGLYMPMLSMLKIDPVNGRLYAGRREKRLLEVYDASLQKIDTIPLTSPLSDMVLSGGQTPLLLEMGIMEPNDQRKGILKRLDAQHQQSILLDSLQRPVHIDYTDLNRDGTPDYLICQYGNETGKLAWYDGKTNKEHLLKYAPGARNTVVTDWNNDGLPDVVVLMCQARERISVFYNRGAGHFDEEVLLEFPPIYGSSYVTVADMNNDGHPDLLYTNGDNADFSYSLKRYHGVRIFLNDGQNHFTEQYFYPIYGAGKVLSADFDGDGDIDMAVISFFTDPAQQPNEGFLFFENKGNLQFEVSTFKDADQGKWLVMDVGDLDRDGRPDIVLGSFNKAGLAQGRVKRGLPPAFVWLRNVKLPVGAR